MPNNAAEGNRARVEKNRSGLDGGERGLTLVEVMIVLFVIAALAYFTAPTLVGWGPRAELRFTAEQFFANMQKAKMHALKNNVNVAFTINTAATCPGGDYSFDAGGFNVAASEDDEINNKDTYNFAPEACLSASTFGAGAGFNPRGLPLDGTGGTVSITYPSVTGVRYDIVQSVAGGVTIEKH